MNIAIYYHPEAYSTTGPRLMGRNAAGESFLRGFLLHSTAREFWVQVEHSKHLSPFAAAVRAAERTEPVRAVDKKNLGALSHPGLVFLPGPGLGEQAWHRSGHGPGAWSLCGITHTTASARVMDAIADLLIAPVHAWDAVVCTSTAVRENVLRVLQAQADYLTTRVGARRITLPQLPVIPLGIHTRDFAFTAEQRSAARASIGATDHTHVVLFAGRLSFHAKAHPLAMYQALEKSVRALPAGHTVVLVECGWHANSFIADAYAEAAKFACPSLRVVTLDGRKPEARQTAWACADVFCSLSDNIQETFGLTPVEAMATGLPVVVADWDGYKDSIRDGVEGFRIPTLMPSAGLGRDLALRHALEIDTYDMYCGYTSSLVAVDIEAASQAFARLFASSDLRHKMGTAGRQRARKIYDWAVIIPRYEALWAQITDLRRTHAPRLAPHRHSWPARPDPFDAFACYPTTILTPNTMLRLVGDTADSAVARVAACQKLAMVRFAAPLFPSEREVRLVLEAATSAPRAAIDLLREIVPERRAFVFRSLAWLTKLGVLAVCS
ncbi:glycosyltransferase family 4 protein [Desulfolutivibrio sulfoxidireducens]|uniref:glycosyltransferase family 4 protein n=1 Tax=Desulfolutivibrio sulfoxidireducens TaxID=2773299 RepID=UPI00159DF79F|nr:glycosyltransferase family 4 protein [Desulfolutivibrio sulfoxidireducens]QLA18207.1 glycosyltransferase [Desulfolutivibrio sulfoxidireducens]